jgi:phasin
MASSPKKNYVPPEPSPVVIEPEYTALEPVAPEPIAAAPVEPDPVPVPVRQRVAVSAPAVFAPPPEVQKMVKDPVASITAFQDKVRAMIEKGLNETRSNYVKAKSAADEASSAFEASYSTAKTGVAEINAKALEALRASAEANFDFMKSIIGVKSMADYVTLHTEFTRKQVERLSGTSKEFGALAKKVAEQSVEPIKAQVAKTFKIAV